MTQRPVKGARRVTRLALLTAIALTIFMVEAQIPVAVPIPGVKLGLANIVTVYTVFALGAGDALLVLVSRVFLGAVFSGQMMTLLYSLGGGLLCWLAMVELKRLLTVNPSRPSSPATTVTLELPSTVNSSVTVIPLSVALIVTVESVIVKSPLFTSVSSST